VSRPRQCLFGLETEYALTARSADGSDVRCRALAEIMASARRGHPWLPGPSGNDLFLGCGCRLYIDVGNHIELSTPECTDPKDLVCAAVAGDRILSELVDEFRRGNGGQVALFKTNVDYLRRVTWASHESYYHSVSPRTMQRIVPFLVTRIIFTGSGGFDASQPGPGGFVLSPRVSFMTRTSTGDSTGSRGIYHAKDEPLGRTGHRLHVLCCESLCSHRQLYLRFGATALVAAMIDIGRAPAIELADPLRAMRALTADVTCRAPVEMGDHSHWAPIEIQRRYLEHAERLYRQGDLPDWAGPLCRVWDDVLSRLESGPSAAVGAVDWATRYALFQTVAHQAGCEFNTEWCRWAQIGQEAVSGHMASPEAATTRRSPARLTELWRHVLRAELLRRGQDVGAFDRFWQLRARMIELDARFAQLVPADKSVFAALDADGALAHGVDGVDADAIARAMTDPPPGGRAEARGRHIRSLGSDSHSMRCNWDSIVDLARSRVLEMPDPFSNSARWAVRASEDPAPEVWRLIGHLASRRRLRWTREQARTPGGPEVGEVVVIGRVGDAADARLLGCCARVTSLDSGGYRLDIDDGRTCWPRVCLRRADRVVAGQVGPNAAAGGRTPGRRGGGNP
jgi:hypothetical protein